MNLTSENYFSTTMQLRYMGVSQFKSFEDCEASALAELRGEFEREKTVSLLVGSYVDAHFCKTLDIFKAQNPEIFKRDGGLKAEYVQADYIIERIERDEMMMKYILGDPQVVLSGEIDGIPVKVKIDAFHAGKAIVDLKIVKDFAPIYKPEQGRLTFVEAWRYDLQGAIYQEVVRQNTGKLLPFYIVGATKEKEPDIAIIQIPQANLDACLSIFKANAQRYADLKKGIGEPIRCEKCDYCKRTKVITQVITMEDLDSE
ncbi:MAG: hypothetical protein GXX92_08275 [Clostridiales bacterium]|nr:hypothetical protein [Clostridiales bacterium]